MAETQDTAAIVDIQYAIDNILLTLSLDKDKTEWVGQQVINCIRDLSTLHNAVSIGTKEVILDIGTNTNTIDMPLDYVDYILAGQIKEKIIYPSSYNQNIPTIKSMECGLDGYDFKSTTTCYSGIQFNENDKERYFQFSGTPYNNKVYLKYLTSGVSLNKQTFIPAIIVTTLTAYVDWRLAVIGTRDNKYRAVVINEQRKGQVYANYVRALEDEKNKVRLADFMRTIYRGRQWQG